MKGNINSLKKGIANFLDMELIPRYKQTHSAAASFGVAVVAALAIENLGKTAETFLDHPVISCLGIIDENSLIDFEKILGIMRTKMPQDGLKVAIPVIGNVTFEQEDIDILEQYLKIYEIDVNKERGV